MLHFEGVKNLGPLWFIRSLSIPRVSMFFILAEFFVLSLPPLCLHSHGEKQRNKDRRWLLIAEGRGTGLSLECLLPCQVFHVRSGFKSSWETCHMLLCVYPSAVICYPPISSPLCWGCSWIILSQTSSYFTHNSYIFLKKFLMVSKHLKLDVLKFTCFDCVWNSKSSPLVSSC